MNAWQQSPWYGLLEQYRTTPFGCDLAPWLSSTLSLAWHHNCFRDIITFSVVRIYWTLPPPPHTKSSHQEKKWRPHEQTLTLMCSSQWVDSILDSQWASSMAGKHSSFSLRELHKIHTKILILRCTGTFHVSDLASNHQCCLPSPSPTP